MGTLGAAMNGVIDGVTTLGVGAVGLVALLITVGPLRKTFTKTTRFALLTMLVAVAWDATIANDRDMTVFDVGGSAAAVALWGEVM